MPHTCDMNPQPQPLPASLGERFTWAEAAGSAVPPSRLRRPDVERVHRATYRRGEARAHSDWRAAHIARVQDVAASLPDYAIVAGVSAAILWGLPIPGPAPEQPLPVEVASLAPARAMRVMGIQSRQVRPRLVRITELGGVRLTDPATTWGELARRYDTAWAVALGDATVHRKRIPGGQTLARPPLAEPDELREVAYTQRRPGALLLQRALPWIATSSASPPESHLRLCLKEWRLPDPELDFDVYDEEGRLLGCSEFAYPEIRLALEYEGRHHLTDPAQWNRDIEKYRDYAEAGWEVLRVTAEHLYGAPHTLRANIEATLSRLATAASLARAAARGQS